MIFETKELFRKYSFEEEFEKLVELDTINDLIARFDSEYKDLIAITNHNQEYSYQKLNEDINTFKGVLFDLEIKKGDRIGIFGGNSYELVKSFLAITSYGAVAFIFPTHLDNKEIANVSDGFNLSCVVFDPLLEDKLAELKIKKVDWNKESNTKVESTIIDKKDPCAIMYTGGTSGKSKGALLSHKAMMQGMLNGCYGVKHIFKQKYVLVLPMSHVFGLIRNMLTPLYTGSNTFICKSPTDFFRVVPIFKPTTLVLVPAIAEMVVTLSKKFKRNMLGDSVINIVCGAAQVPPYLAEYFSSLNITLLPGYGLTESANLVSGNPLAKEKPTSVGIPFPHQEFKIVDGELWLKGTNMLDCYVGKDAENETAFSDGWFKTGDLVSFDEDGFLYIVGRCKDIIILGNGENVSPALVEKYFDELNIVQASQVFEDVVDGDKHILALEVFLRMTEINKLGVENYKEYALNELKKVNNNLPAHYRVSRIEIRDKDFERTPNMKIVRYKKCN